MMAVERATNSRVTKDICPSRGNQMNLSVAIGVLKQVIGAIVNIPCRALSIRNGSSRQPYASWALSFLTGKASPTLKVEPHWDGRLWPISADRRRQLLRRSEE